MPSGSLAKLAASLGNGESAARLGFGFIAFLLYLVGDAASAAVTLLVALVSSSSESYVKALLERPSIGRTTGVLRSDDIVPDLLLSCRVESESSICSSCKVSRGVLTAV